jgi:N-acyl-D-amino-acid deacylase
MHDILIRGGTLFDGTGKPGVAGDLAIVDGRIAAVGPDSAATARKIIDADGLAVAPGFIDIKTHSDFTLPINPKAESKVRQGVTTEIIGHCGFSVAPALPGKVELLKDYLSPSAPWLPFRETSFPDYLETFPATAVNAGMLVGHNTLRLMVMGMAERAPTDAELAQMIALLEDALEAGALGLSSGLFTPPGSYAAPSEMIALGHVLKKYNAGYFTHLRDEANKVIDAVAEAIEIAERCGVHVEIVAEPRQHRLDAARLHPWRQQVLQRVRSGGIGIGIAVDVEAARPGVGDHAERGRGLTPIVHAGAFEMHADVVFRNRRHQHAGRALVLDEIIAQRIDRIGAALG